MMDIQTELEIEGGLTQEEVRHLQWRARLLAAGIRPASGPWPPGAFEPIKPRFYRIRRLFWPLRSYIRRFV
jgi:hypothetical protein